VVAAILPSLMLIGRSRAYPIVRIGGAAFAAAAGWLVERLSNITAPQRTAKTGLAQFAE
jgi:high-affinity Fe2+/Pb2+ permease